MRWKVVALLGAVTGGIVWAARRQVRREEAEAALWSEATDPVSPSA